MKFIKFILIWISQQLAIPFWMIGHFHLSLSLDVYSDVKILFASLGMNVLVAIGFWLDWKQFSAPKADHIKPLQQQITQNRKSVGVVSDIVKNIMEEIKNVKIYK